jgi:periplasmic protein CpxP/Spy
MKYRYAMWVRPLALTVLLGSGILGAQQVTQWKFIDPPPQAHRPAILDNTLPGGAYGRWWYNLQMALRLSLTPDQQKKMDDVFQQSRLKLIDLTAALDKEEAILEPLVEADQPDAPKIRVQIDRIAQARAELEKANANMLLGIRLILTPDQWKSLQSSGGAGPRARRLKDMSSDSSTSPPVPKKK